MRDAFASDVSPFGRDRQRTALWPRLLDIFIILFIARALVWVLGGLNPRALADDGGDGGAIYTLLSGVIYLYCSTQLLVRFSGRFKVGASAFLYTAFIVFCFASAYWSIDREATLVRSVSLTGTFIVAAYFAAKYRVDEFVELVGEAFLLIAVLSIALALVLPDYGTQPDGDNAGNWRGLFQHKNVAAYAMIVGLLSHIHMKQRTGRRIWSYAIGADLVFLLGASSRTSMICLALIALNFFMIRAVVRGSSLSLGSLLLVLTGAGVVSSLVAFNVEEVLALFGRDLTLTGRTTIWGVALDYLSGSPWLGYGYQAAWRSDDGMPLYMLRYGWQWNPSQSHNGYIDVMLGVGVLGIAICLLAFLNDVVRSSRALAGDDREAAWMLQIMLATIFVGFSGRVIMQPNTFYALLSFYVGCSLLKASAVAVRRDRTDWAMSTAGPTR